MGRRFDFWGENADAFNSREPEILLAGPAGTGKSACLATKMLALLDKYPGSRGLFCRGTRSSLTNSGLVTWEDDVLGPDHPVLLHHPTLRYVRKSYLCPNGSELVLAGLDDPGKTLSTQFDFVYIQEATEEGVSEDTYETLTRAMRNRRMRKDGRAWHQVMMDCNPTSPFHWIYQRVQKGRLRMYTSRHQDNPAFYDREKRDWTEDGRAYIEGTLAAMSGTRRKRFFLGEWAAAEGLVYDGFLGRPWDDPTEPGHLLPKGWEPPRGWRRLWGVDWGESAPTALVMAADDGNDRLHFYREVYRTRLRPDELGRWAAREVMAGREPEPEVIVGDHDPVKVAEFERGAREEGHALHVQQADKRDRMEGITAVQARFDKPYRIFLRPDSLVSPDPAIDTGPNCLIGELVEYKYDPNSLLDRPDPKAADHALDGCRYVCRYADSNPAGPKNYVPPADLSPRPRTPWDGGAARRYGVR